MRQLYHYPGITDLDALRSEKKTIEEGAIIHLHMFTEACARYGGSYYAKTHETIDPARSDELGG